MAETLRHCTACGEDKPLTEFHRDKSQASGYMCQCKTCRRILRRISYEKNKPKQLARQRERIAAIMADPISKREFYWIKNLKSRYNREQKRNERQQNAARLA